MPQVPSPTFDASRAQSRVIGQALLAPFCLNIDWLVQYRDFLYILKPIQNKDWRS